MKLYSYIVVHDTGFAPNPFWGYCTLAACTPNHVGIRAQKGDWIIGTETKQKGNKLIYAMEISEILPFEQYYNDPRFRKKKPVIDGTWRQQCGDNIYYKDAKGNWRQHPSLFHTHPKQIKQDLKHPKVFIAKHFYYFGKKVVGIPKEYQSLIWRRQGVKCKHDSEVIRDFLKWLQSNFESGIQGEPEDSTKCSLKKCKMHL